LTGQMRDLLETRGDWTVAQFSARLGVPEDKVRSAVSCMRGKRGGIVQTGWIGNARLYGKPGRDDVVKRSMVGVAGGRYVADGFRPLVRDPYEHRDLALAGR